MADMLLAHNVNPRTSKIITGVLSVPVHDCALILMVTRDTATSILRKAIIYSREESEHDGGSNMIQYLWRVACRVAPCSGFFRMKPFLQKGTCFPNSSLERIRT